ncbi:MAG: hypothetical protein MZV70_13780 [Desulfobacterales bacterium]|nr:hypothetical protein [Desulfobacterales bacterium]
MYLGKFVEQGRTEDLFASPKHPYTEILLASAPKIRMPGGPSEQEIRKEHQKALAFSSKDVPSPIAIPRDAPSIPAARNDSSPAIPSSPSCGTWTPPRLLPPLLTSIIGIHFSGNLLILCPSASMTMNDLGESFSGYVSTFSSCLRKS